MPSFLLGVVISGVQFRGGPNLPWVEASVSESNFPLLQEPVGVNGAQHLCLGGGKAQSMLGGSEDTYFLRAPWEAERSRI